MVLLGYGDIAQRLAKLAEQRGRSVFAVRRTPSCTNDSHLTEIICGDVTNAETLKTLLAGGSCDIVVTLTPDDYSEDGYRNTYLACTQALATIASDMTTDSRVIYVSSTSVYGQNNGEVVDESSHCEPRSATAKVLLEAEQVINSLPIQHCNLRFTGIYGPGRHRIISSVKDGRIAPQTPTHWTNRIHADDCASILDFLIQQNTDTLPSTLIGTDNQCVTRWTVQNYIAALLKGERLSSMTHNSGDDKSASETEQTGKRCSNTRLMELGYEYLYPSYKEGFSALINPEN